MEDTHRVSSLREIYGKALFGCTLLFMGGSWYSKMEKIDGTEWPGNVIIHWVSMLGHSLSKLDCDLVDVNTIAYKVT